MPDARSWLAGRVASVVPKTTAAAYVCHPQHYSYCDWRQGEPCGISPYTGWQISCVSSCGQVSCWQPPSCCK